MTFVKSQVVYTYLCRPKSSKYFCAYDYFGSHYDSTKVQYKQIPYKSTYYEETESILCCHVWLVLDIGETQSSEPIDHDDISELCEDDTRERSMEQYTRIVMLLFVPFINVRIDLQTNGKSSPKLKELMLKELINSLHIAGKRNYQKF